ncbi:hypothetical protein OIE67_40975 [Nonomuraea fuscirosea]|uniref:hypothetical protein n=1 Tax=Nonomuraea fuscirosea TaxID=1291556 RepID=UPI002DDB476F|nr:hypothetical protein [Nonomuraea fuscirosea]WSA50386.1 hypothetical protein OIE67_40975 [Nonomuraea fuscirosea]
MNDHVRLHCLRHAESENVVTGTAGAQPSAALTSLVAAHPGGTIAVVGHVASLTTGLGVLCGLGGRVWGAPLPHAVPFLVEYGAGPGPAWRCPDWPGE